MSCGAVSSLTCSLVGTGDFCLGPGFAGWVCCAIMTEASAASWVRLSLKYHSFAVLSEWHIRHQSSCSSIGIPNLFFRLSSVTIHFRKSVAEMALSGRIPDFTTNARALHPIVPFWKGAPSFLRKILLLGDDCVISQ